MAAVIEAVKDYDAIYCLGDIVGYGAQPNEVVDEVRRLRPQAVLMGNHDYATVTGDTSGFSTNAAIAVDWTRKKIRADNMQYLKSLSPIAQFSEGGEKLAICHGSPRDPLSEYIYPGLPEFILKGMLEEAGSPRVLLMGHTHVPFQQRLASCFAGNPGSVGQPRDGDARASCGILAIEEGRVSFEVRRIEYNIDSAASRIQESGLPGFLADRLYIGT